MSSRCEGIFKIARFVFAIALEDNVKDEGNKALLSEYDVEGSLRW
jgi:hypothetical protein